MKTLLLAILFLISFTIFAEECASIRQYWSNSQSQNKHELAKSILANNPQCFDIEEMSVEEAAKIREMAQQGTIALTTDGAVDIYGSDDCKTKRASWSHARSRNDHDEARSILVSDSQCFNVEQMSDDDAAKIRELAQSGISVDNATGNISLQNTDECKTIIQQKSNAQSRNEMDKAREILFGNQHCFNIEIMSDEDAAKIRDQAHRIVLPDAQVIEKECQGYTQEELKNMKLNLPSTPPSIRAHEKYMEYTAKLEILNACDDNFTFSHETLTQEEALAKINEALGKTTNTQLVDQPITFPKPSIDCSIVNVPAARQALDAGYARNTSLIQERTTKTQELTREIQDANRAVTTGFSASQASTLDSLKSGSFNFSGTDKSITTPKMRSLNEIVTNPIILALDEEILLQGTKNAVNDYLIDSCNNWIPPMPLAAVAPVQEREIDEGSSGTISNALSDGASSLLPAIIDVDSAVIETQDSKHSGSLVFDTPVITVDESELQGTEKNEKITPTIEPEVEDISVADAMTDGTIGDTIQEEDKLEAITQVQEATTTKDTRDAAANDLKKKEEKLASINARIAQARSIAEAYHLEETLGLSSAMAEVRAARDEFTRQNNLIAGPIETGAIAGEEQAQERENDSNDKGTECVQAVTKYFSEYISKDTMDKYLQIQSKLTMHRLAWAYLEKMEDDTKPIEENIKILVNKMDAENIQDIEGRTDFETAKKQFNKAPMSRRALADIVPYMKDILVDQSANVTEENKMYQIHEADIKMLDILSERERENQNFNGRQFSNREHDNSVLNILFIINASYSSGEKLKGANKQKHIDILAWQIKKLEDELTDTLNSMGTPLQCSDEAMGTLCCSELTLKGQERFNELMKNCSEMTDALNEGINKRSINEDKYNRVRYGDIWLHTAF